MIIVIDLHRRNSPHMIATTPDDFVRAWSKRFGYDHHNLPLNSLHEIADDWGLLIEEAEFVPGVNTSTIEECLNDLD